VTVTLPDISELIDWIMLAPEREWFAFGMLVGMFLMFSVLSGYWIVSAAVLRWVRRMRADK